MTAEGDIVLIYFENKPLVFARIEKILPDSKPAWYHVKLLMLQVPVHTITWILRDSYIDGAEFTMNGKKVRLERVVCPKDPEEPKKETKSSETKDPGGARVISFADLKKK
ncbi:MAG: hypothetical protein BWK74_01720 [Desulfobacteraceae bacterium A6]|nr:MAG: hypothetical protein BWK74_01720 [Desulfobacteraceae bacterium A6]